MEDLQSSLTIAAEQYENGQIKDAYNTFLALTQQSIKPLFDVKFVHNSIVSKPNNSDTLLTLLHSCVDYIDRIMDTHSLTSNTITKMVPPPLPPKPSHVSKPVLPPKPIKPAKRNSSLSEHTTFIKQTTAVVKDTVEKINHEDVPDGEVDASELVPAQTNNSDSLTPTTVSGTSDHIPNIPIPPLLKTHRVLQAKLDELEGALKDFRQRKNQLEPDQQSHKEDLDYAIEKYTPYVAEAKLTLNRVRTMYMSAATIPSVLHFQPGMVAYQLTRIESAIFLAIPSHALLSHTPKTPQPRIVASSDFFNYVTRMIEHSILLPQEASVRAQHIHHWIKIACKCQELNNYQTLKAIISALGTPPVQRLKRTWAYIPKKSLSRLDTMTELMSEASNYGKYREHMGIVSTSVLNGKSVNLIQSEHYKRPTVPFLGTFIHDMTYLLAAVQQKQHLTQDPRIHKLLEILQKFQSTPRYERKPNATIAKIIHKTQNQVRPALSQAIHRSKSSFGKLGGAIGLGGTENSTNDLPHMDDFDAEEQHSLIMQYLLMRPWVSQNTVDELSLLREPPVQNNTSRTSSSNYSIMSNASSFMRLSNPATTSSTLTLASSLDSRPASLDDARYHHFEDEETYRDWNDTTLYAKVEAPSIPPRPNTRITQ